MVLQGRSFFFDIETNGLLDTATELHTLVLQDIDTGEVISCSDHWEESEVPLYKLSYGLGLLEDAALIVGHNVIKFDVPMLQKLKGFKTKAVVRDTLVLTRLLWADLWQSDAKLVNTGKLPSRLTGSHSLEAWGYRLGEMKGEYGRDENGKRMVDIWAHWNPEMQSYCEQDVRVTAALYAKIIAANPAKDAIELEHQFADIIGQQERHGFAFDEASAQQLYVSLIQKRLKLSQELTAAFPPKVTREEFIPKVNNKTRGYVKGVPFIKEKVVEFNPSSRPMIAQRLMEKGWKPKEFTDSGAPKVDEAVLKKLQYPEAQLLADYFLIEKRIGQLAEGDQAWLRLVRDGRIHGSVNTNGAVTGRCTHSHPNVAQVPRVGSPYGTECRSLFMASPGKVLVGADLAGLELRCLAHYMAKWDGGAYGKVLLEGDIHWANVQAMGLTNEDRDDSRKDHKLYRNGAKTFIYGFLYGAGDVKVGSIVLDIVRSMAREGFDVSELERRFFGGASHRVIGVRGLASAGSILKARFLEKTPALKKLQAAIQTSLTLRDYLIGLDGRKLSIRSKHAALNTLLQSAGALVAKKATALAYQELSTRGFKFGRDWALIAHIHDEMQVEAKEAIADEVGTVLVSSMRRAGEVFGFRVPIDGEYKLGRTWADTH